ncbi:hypothetical protein D0Z07_7685 [Hyphodiscus hymeniophilus]|uniref:Non-ribosomal peptide synthetase n=1 Tax=Hyphodiscus hymeniophilus TaxID=353542 RepID=A0A9P6SLC4_9HELO|nr:hypothetical protein D0Z07_7685 [Hyphodiscus hymeniophilus]
MASIQTKYTDGDNQNIDDAENGLYDKTQSLIVLQSLTHVYQKTLTDVESPLSPISAIHEGITPSSSVPVLSLSRPAGRQPNNAAGSNIAAEKPTHLRPKPGRLILFQLWFNTYRKFFTFVTLLNLTGLIMAAIGRFPYAENHLGALVLGNLLFAILMRNELFLRFLYIIAIHGLRSARPFLIIHTMATNEAFMVGIIRHHAVQDSAVIATGIVTNVLVFTSVLSAFPWVRSYHHNIFEKHHRFIGWLGLAVCTLQSDLETGIDNYQTTWVFVILGNTYDITLGQWRTNANSLLSAQELWFAVFMTIFVLIPWFTLREVPVEVEIPSSKVAILRFERGMQQGLLGRISRTSIMEYHAFGIISEGRGSPYHYMICGVQGDFTKSLVVDPPKTVWTREFKFAGVGHASAMFQRGIRICTGTGIGAALSTCIQSPNWFLIWIGSDQESTFGPTITGLIRKHIEPERMILWDSKKRGGRPDTMKLLKDTWVEFGAEVIFITSNMQGNAEMLRGCHEGMYISILITVTNLPDFYCSAGLHAFGTLWDF